MSESSTRFDLPDALARAFLAALDDRRWRDAAALIHPDTAERFRRQQIARIREEEPSEGLRHETVFAPTASLLRVVTAEEAETLPATELLARFAEALDPAAVLRRMDEPSPDPLRLKRTVLRYSEGSGTTATVEYRTEWWSGARRHDARGGVHVLTAMRTVVGWRVRDADLGGSGDGHIILPDERFNLMGDENDPGGP